GSLGRRYAGRLFAARDGSARAFPAAAGPRRAEGIHRGKPLCFRRRDILQHGRGGGAQIAQAHGRSGRQCRNPYIAGRRLSVERRIVMRAIRLFTSAALTARLTRRMLAIVAASFVLLLVILEVQYLMVRDTLRDRGLVAQAADIAAHVGVASDGTVTLDLPDTLKTAYGRPDRQYV